MQVLDTDFYPAATEKRGGILIKILIGLACAALLAFIAARAFAWTGQRGETELLVLANPWNSVDAANFSPKLQDIGGGYQADKRCAADLAQMLADCEAAGNSPYICSAYRSRDTQQQLFDNKIQRLIEAGLDPELAPGEAAQEVARPGTSEHELGLAFDIVDTYYQTLDEAQAETATQQWLAENSWRYGFILRYPAGAAEYTGVIYEPWHYRYVGRDAAEQIYQLGITLEEYLAMFYSEQATIKFEK